MTVRPIIQPSFIPSDTPRPPTPELWLAYDGDDPHHDGMAVFEDEITARRYAMGPSGFTAPRVLPLHYGQPIGKTIMNGILEVHR